MLPTRLFAGEQRRAAEPDEETHGRNQRRRHRVRITLAKRDRQDTIENALDSHRPADAASEAGRPRHLAHGRTRSRRSRSPQAPAARRVSSESACRGNA